MRHRLLDRRPTRARLSSCGAMKATLMRRNQSRLTHESSASGAPNSMRISRTPPLRVSASRCRKFSTPAIRPVSFTLPIGAADSTLALRSRSRAASNRFARFSTALIFFSRRSLEPASRYDVTACRSDDSKSSTRVAWVCPLNWHSPLCHVTPQSILVKHLLSHHPHNSAIGCPASMTKRGRPRLSR